MGAGTYFLVRWLNVHRNGCPFQGLQRRQVKPDGANSDTHSVREEIYNDNASEVSSCTYDGEGRIYHPSLGPNSLPVTILKIDREEAAAQELVGSSSLREASILTNLPPFPPRMPKEDNVMSACCGCVAM